MFGLMLAPWFIRHMALLLVADAWLMQMMMVVVVMAIWVIMMMMMLMMTEMLI